MTTNTPYNPNTASPLTLAWENYKKSWVHWGTRATRREYWWSWFIGVCCCNLLWISSMAVCMMFEPAFNTRNESLILSILFCIPIVLLGIPSLGLIVRRCHDAGFPTMGAISLNILLLIPYLGALFAVLLFFALIQDSDKAENPWGISTKYQLPQKHSPEDTTNTTAVCRAKDILNCRGYYSGKAFAWHVGIAAVLSFVITLWSFGPAALFASLLQRFEILQSICLKQNIEYILLMFASVTSSSTSTSKDLFVTSNVIPLTDSDFSAEISLTELNVSSLSNITTLTSAIWKLYGPAPNVKRNIGTPL